MIDRTTLRLMRQEIEEAVQQVAQKFNVNIEAGNASFSSDNATLKLAISTIDASGNVLTKEAQAFETYAPMYGITKKLGETFETHQGIYTLVGFKPKSKKYPILATNAKGKTYKFPTSILANDFQLVR